MTYRRISFSAPCKPKEDKKNCAICYYAAPSNSACHDVCNGCFDYSLFKPKEESASETQVGGLHYKDMKIQPIEFSMKNNLNFCQGNVIKYVCRYKAKNGLEDLKKARHYIDLLIEHEESKK